MYAIKAEFDGEKVIVPDTVRGLPPGEVIVVFTNGVEEGLERAAWMKAQEDLLAKAWINDEDAIYDNL